jgi:phage terminase Nu1 subunit (DNA packaging protein)
VISLGRELSKVINDKLCITTEYMAKIFDVNPRALQAWGEKGCPREGRGWWPIAEVMRWKGIVGNGVSQEGNEKINLNQKKTDADIKLKELKAQEAELKNGIMMGEFLRKDEVVTGLQKLLMVLKKSMQSYSRKVANEISPHVDAITTRRVEKMVMELTSDALEQIAFDGIYQPSKKKAN